MLAQSPPQSSDGVLPNEETSGETAAVQDNARGDNATSKKDLHHRRLMKIYYDLCKKYNGDTVWVEILRYVRDFFQTDNRKFLCFNSLDRLRCGETDAQTALNEIYDCTERTQLGDIMSMKLDLLSHYTGRSVYKMFDVKRPFHRSTAPGPSKPSSSCLTCEYNNIECIGYTVKYGKCANCKAASSTTPCYWASESLGILTYQQAVGFYRKRTFKRKVCDEDEDEDNSPQESNQEDAIISSNSTEESTNSPESTTYSVADVGFYDEIAPDTYNSTYDLTIDFQNAAGESEPFTIKADLRRLSTARESLKHYAFHAQGTIDNWRIVSWKSRGRMFWRGKLRQIRLPRKWRSGIGLRWIELCVRRDR